MGSTTDEKMIYSDPVFLMEQSVTLFLQRQRRFVSRLRNPSLIFLYGNSDYAQRVAPSIMMQAIPGQVSAKLLELSTLRGLASRIAPDYPTMELITGQPAEGSIRVVLIGYERFVVYDQSASVIFSMLN